LIANKLTHLVGTYDGSSLLTIYVNGVQAAQTSGVGTPFEGYTTPYFVVGGSGGTTFNSAVVLFCNFANACWTPTEVRARAADPFSMFVPPPRPVLAFDAPPAPSATVPVLGGLLRRGITDGRLTA